MSDVIELPPSPQPLVEPVPAPVEALPDWRTIVSSGAFRAAALVFIGICAIYWPLLKRLPELWLSEDGYYSHGFLIPLISGYIVYKWWPRLKNIPVKPGYLAGLLILPIVWIAIAAVVSDFRTFASLSLIALALTTVWFVAGWRWMWSLSGPIGYLAFCLPMWSSVIDNYTLPLQMLSSKVAYQMLSLVGLSPLKGTGGDATVIYLDHFTLDVGVPCSGLKLVLAITAFTAFFVMISRLSWAKSLLMVVLIMPLCLIINGLRIALIGIVGNAYGTEAGHTFHDYSGYITLIICFLILFKFVRMLGWKD